MVSAEDKKTTIYAQTSLSSTSEEDSDESEQHNSYSVIAELVGHLNRFALLSTYHSPKYSPNFKYRVKSIDTLRITLPTSPPSTTTILASASSDGMIHVYDLSSVPIPSASVATVIETISPIAEYDTKGTRLTCLTLAASDSRNDGGSSSPVGGKRTRVDESEESDNGEDDDAESSDEEDEDEEEENE